MQQLERTEDNESRRQIQVATPQSSWLGEEAVQPFKPGRAHPRRRAVDAATMEIERRADADRDRVRELFDVVAHPDFLFWTAKSNPNDVRRSRVDFRYRLIHLLGGH